MRFSSGAMAQVAGVANGPGKETFVSSLLRQNLLGVAMRLAARDVGQGEVLVLLHGLFGRAQNFAGVARRLSARFRVISLDLRNHGDSPHAAGMDYPVMAADVAETLDAIGVARCSLLGHSMGGKVAMAAALGDGARYERLMVVDIAPVSYRHANARVAQAMLALPLHPGLTRAAADAALAEAVPDGTIRAFLLQNMGFGERPGWRIGLAEIAEAIGVIEAFPDFAERRYAGPCVFLRGGESGYVTDEAWPAIRRLFPAARLETLEGAGHWLHADRPDAFLNAVERFLLDSDQGA